MNHGFWWKVNDKVFFVTRGLDDEKALVNDPRRARRVWMWMCAWALLGFAAIMICVMAGDTWYEFVAGLFASAIIGRGALLTMRRAWAYRRGWLDGRMDIINSLAEASRRGMDLEEWAQLEAERDMKVMGG